MEVYLIMLSVCVWIFLFPTLNLSDSKFEQTCLRGRDFKDVLPQIWWEKVDIRKNPFHVFTEEMTEIIVKFLLNCREYWSKNNFWYFPTTKDFSLGDHLKNSREFIIKLQETMLYHFFSRNCLLSTQRNGRNKGFQQNNTFLILIYSIAQGNHFASFHLLRQ